MTRFPLILAALFLIAPVSAQVATTNAQTRPAPSTNQPVKAPSPITLVASNGVIIAPLYLTNGYLTQAGERTDGTDGGYAIFEFSITNAGDYVIHGTVSAPDEESNSFFLNIDEHPEDPTMIWDIVVAEEFEEQVVNWRGTGASGSDEFDPKVFKLTTGKHRLFIYGREPNAKLKSLSIRPYSPPPAK